MSKVIDLTPIFDNLVVEKIKPQEKTNSGFYMPETSQKKSNVHKVLKIGSGCKSGVKEGDLVLLPKNLQVTTDVEVNGNEVSVVKEEHIIAIVNIEE